MECDVVPSLANMTVTSLVSFLEFLLLHRNAKLMKLAIIPIDEGLPSVSDFYNKNLGHNFKMVKNSKSRLNINCQINIVLLFYYYHESGILE